MSRKPYVAKQSANWYLQNRFFKLYMLRELTSVPVALAGTLAVTVKVAVPPTGSDTRPLIAPLPLLGVGQLAPALAAQLQLEKLALVGSASVTLAPITGMGPLLPATTV